MIRSDARVVSLWYRNPCIRSNRCLSAAKFIGFSAISQSCRCVPGAAACAASSLPGAAGFFRSSSSLEPVATPVRFATLRNSFGNFPIFISARYYIKNSKLAPLSPLEFSLSYKGFAATYNISPPFPCHFILLQYPPSPICLLVSSLHFSLSLSFMPLVRSPSSAFEMPCLLRLFFGIRLTISTRPSRYSHGHPPRRFLADLD